MLRRIHHVGVVVRSADEALRFFRDTLGLAVSKDAVIEDQGVRGVLLPAGDSEIELLEPVREGTGVARFLERGEGLHHVCFESDDVGAELEAAQAKGLRLIDDKPRQGLAGMIGFLHPAATKGVLVEFATPPAGEAHHAAAGMVRNFDHLVVAVKDLEEGAQVWNKNFGFEVQRRGESQELGIRNAILPVDGAFAFVELITPLSDETPAGRYLQQRGEGMYLISLAVNNLDQAVSAMKEKGLRVTGPMAGGLAFLNPRECHGVYIQLRQRQ